MSNKQTGNNGARGKPGPGRPKGSPNKTTSLLKDAIILAAEAEGEDGNGKSGLIGYCRMLARDEKKAFAQLMGRALPLQISGNPDDNTPILFKTIYESRDGD